MKDDLKKIDWKGLMEGKELYFIAELFIDLLNQYTDTQKNTTKTKMSYRKSGRSDRITPSLLESIDRKNSLYREMMRNQLNVGLKQQYAKYLTVCH